MKHRVGVSKQLFAGAIVGLVVAMTTPAGAAVRPVWTSQFSTPGASASIAHATAVSPDGTRVFVTGETGATGMQTIAYDAASGAQVWSSSYLGKDVIGGAVAIAVSPDGARVFVEGYSGDSSYDFVTLALNATTGKRLWIARAPGGNEFPAGMVVSPDGGSVFVTGEINAAGKPTAATTIAYDATTGQRRWIKHYAHVFLVAGLAASPDNTRVYVAVTDSRSDIRFAIVAYDTATGNQVWVGRYSDAPKGTRPDAEAAAIVVSPDSATVYVTGSNYQSATRSDLATVAFDAGTGTQRWASTWDGQTHEDDFATALTVSGDGSAVLVTGTSPTEGTNAAVVVAYDAATGTQHWAESYAKPRTIGNAPAAIAVSPDGATTAVTGVSAAAQHSGDFATLLFDTATGANRGRLFRTGTAESADGGGQALAFSSSGDRLYVTGAADLDSAVAFTTIAYPV